MVEDEQKTSKELKNSQLFSLDNKKESFNESRRLDSIAILHSSNSKESTSNTLPSTSIVSIILNKSTPDNSILISL